MFKRWQFRKIQILLSTDKLGYQYFSIWYQNTQILIVDWTTGITIGLFNKKTRR